MRRKIWTKQLWKQRNRLEQGIIELDNTTNKLTEAINKADAKNLAEDTEILVQRTNKELEEFSKLPKLQKGELQRCKESVEENRGQR